MRRALRAVDPFLLVLFGAPLTFLALVAWLQPALRLFVLGSLAVVALLLLFVTIPVEVRARRQAAERRRLMFAEPRSNMRRRWITTHRAG